MRTLIPATLAVAFLLSACDKPPPKPPQPIAAVAGTSSQMSA